MKSADGERCVDHAEKKSSEGSSSEKLSIINQESAKNCVYVL